MRDTPILWRVGERSQQLAGFVVAYFVEQGQRITELEIRMAEAVTNLRERIDGATTRIGDDVRDVAGIIRALVKRIAAGEQAAVDELTPAVERLEGAADVLTRMARSDENPLPDEDSEPLERSGGDVERSGGDVENPPAQRG